MHESVNTVRLMVKKTKDECDERDPMLAGGEKGKKKRNYHTPPIKNIQRKQTSGKKKGHRPPEPTPLQLPNSYAPLLKSQIPNPPLQVPTPKAPALLLPPSPLLPAPLLLASRQLHQAPYPHTQSAPHTLDPSPPSPPSPPHVHVHVHDRLSKAGNAGNDDGDAGGGADDAGAGESWDKNDSGTGYVDAGAGAGDHKNGTSPSLPPHPRPSQLPK